MGKKEANEELKKLLYGKRSCGDCRACCTTHYITELKKEEGVTCPNVVTDNPAGGCGIYDTRPASCAAWACLWRSGSNVLGEGERPDKNGVVIEAQGEDMLVAKEAFEGGFTHAMKLLTRLANKRLVQLREADGKSGVAFGPSHQLPKYVALMDVVHKAEKKMREAQAAAKVSP